MQPNDYNSVALQRVNLKELDPNLTNVLIVGVIIGKQKPRTFVVHMGQSDSIKAVWNFTLRDSIQDYINVTLWGNHEQVFQTNEKFRTGDIVEILNPQILIRQIGDRGEDFQPMVTSPYKLSLNEKSDIILHPNKEAFFLNLLRYPTKPTTMFVPLQDLQNSGSSMQDTFVDILCAVRGLGQIRSVTTRNEAISQVRDVEVFDHTCPSLKITIWEPDIIERSNCWNTRNTILFFTDVKVEWSNFDKSYVAKVTSKTILTENPVSSEAKLLHEYAKSAPIETYDILEQLITSLPEGNTIPDLVSVKQVHDRINLCLQNRQLGSNYFTVLLQGFITGFDLDGLSKTVSIKCGRCKMPVQGTKCENSNCPAVFESEYAEPDITFDIKVEITDHTGTLLNCVLSGHAADKALRCTAREFSQMSDDQKCELKWNYLMERCSIRLGVFFMIKCKPIISILSMERSNLLDVARRLPIY